MAAYMKIFLMILTAIFWGIAAVIQFMIHNRTSETVPTMVKSLLIIFVALGCFTFCILTSPSFD